MGQLRPQLLKEGREGRDNSGRGEGAGPKRVTYAAARSVPCRRTHASAVRRLGERTDRSPDALPASIPTAGTMRSEGRADGQTDGSDALSSLRRERDRLQQPPSSSSRPPPPPPPSNTAYFRRVRRRTRREERVLLGRRTIVLFFCVASLIEVMVLPGCASLPIFAVSLEVPWATRSIIVM